MNLQRQQLLLILLIGLLGVTSLGGCLLGKSLDEDDADAGEEVRADVDASHDTETASDTDAISDTDTASDTNATSDTGGDTATDTGGDTGMETGVDTCMKTTYYEDSDGDSFGNADVTREACQAPAGYVDNKEDCDDSNASINPDASEKCDGVDNNCDGTKDPSNCSCQNGATQECGKSTGVCKKGTQTCSGGSWGSCQGGVSMSTEICDGKDNDCDGDTDEKSAQDAKTFYRDSDGDNYGNPSQSQKGCSAPPGYVDNKEDCDDTDADIDPDAIEKCDGVDNNCDGTIDPPSCSCTNGDSQSCGESTGICTTGTQTCTNGSWGTCMGGIQPASEVCDGQDNDCDGKVDENLTDQCSNQTGVCSGSTVACQNGSYPSCGASEFGSDYESGTETSCDNKDNDCDGKVDENITKQCPLQTGVCQGATTSCSAGSYATCGMAQYGANYESAETSDDKLDNDCDGMVDNVVDSVQIGTAGADSGDDVLYDTGKDTIYLSYDAGSDFKVARWDDDFTESWTYTNGYGYAGGVAFSPSLFLGGSTIVTGGRVLSQSPDTYDLEKVDLSGTQQWNKSSSSSDRTAISDVAINPNNEYIYAVGWAEGDLSQYTTNNGKRDIMLLKYDHLGNSQWAKLIGGSKSEEGIDAAVDPSTGDVYVAGKTRGSFNGVSNSGLASFVTRYDSSGNEQWTKIFGGTAKAVVFDSQRDAVYVAGDTDGSLAGQTSQGSYDGYVARYEKNGNRDWVVQFGSSGSDRMFGAAVDEATGAVYVAGISTGNFGGQTPKGSSDAAVAKYDVKGNEEWQVLYGTSSADQAAEIALDPDTDDMYIVGETEGAFGGATNQGGRDAFLLRRKD